ncbi:MAG: DUF1080 domain-containing protein [Acidobacteria bacterium]|nr:DUF1080 domain-containing protein [Acidobacteriota bacterium]
MRRLASLIVIATALQAASPFAGKWNFNVSTPNGNRASWLGITEKAGTLEVWYQPTGGHVVRVEDVKLEGNSLKLLLGRPADKVRPTLDLEISGDKMTGTFKRGDMTQSYRGVRAPALNHKVPKAWDKPEPLFNGKDLTGWEPIGKPESNHWIVRDGYLVNESKGANLKSTRSFQDFKLHFEVNSPDQANSGVYLRGRYEIQLESAPQTQAPPERRMGSIYGRIAPKGDLPRKTDVWDTFDINLVGRTITVVRNGVMTIDAQEIEGITGGALDANEAEPGPFYIQGDHTGGLKFRNITVALPKR